MDFKLINDHIPDLYKEEFEKSCKVASVLDTEFFMELLFQQLKSTVEKFTATKHPVHLADIRLVIDALCELYGGLEKFEPIFIDRLNHLGRFEKRFIGLIEQDELDQLTESFLIKDKE